MNHAVVEPRGWTSNQDGFRAYAADLSRDLRPWPASPQGTISVEDAVRPLLTATYSMDAARCYVREGGYGLGALDQAICRDPVEELSSDSPMDGIDPVRDGRVGRVLVVAFRLGTEQGRRLSWLSAHHPEYTEGRAAAPIVEVEATKAVDDRVEWSDLLRPWPGPCATISLEDAVRPLVAVVEASGHALFHDTRGSAGGYPPLRYVECGGYDLGSWEKATCLDPARSLVVGSVSGLDPVRDGILGRALLVSFQLGVEQGRRLSCPCNVVERA